MQWASKSGLVPRSGLCQLSGSRGMDLRPARGALVLAAGGAALVATQQRRPCSGLMSIQVVGGPGAGRLSTESIPANNEP